MGKKYEIILLTVICAILFLFIGGMVFPHLFYDQFIWKYFWGPIVSDAVDHTVTYNGVQAAPKFTIVSEIVYGALVILAIYGIYKILELWKIKVDWRFCLALTPYFTLGAVTRVLEDSSFFHPPFVYWFVTPLIYFQILVLVFLFFIIGYLLEKHFNNPYITINSVLLFAGTVIILPFLFYIGQWILGNQWSESTGVRFDIFYLISLSIFIILTVIYVISTFYKENHVVSIYKKPLNLAMIGGHLLDGLASYISIHDPLGWDIPQYIEKHPFSDALMNFWPPLFPIVKFLLIVLIIYLLDIYYKEELREYSRLVNLLKIGIFMLGFSPGLRDLIRVTMGV